MPRRDKGSALKEAAKILGRRGGDARRQSLNKARRRDIASQGGKAKAAAEKNK